MSDLNEGPGELPPELRDFYDAHRDTGQPTGAQLGKALLRVHTGTRPAAPMTLSRRRWVPPELLAVAALLVLTVGGGAIGWYVKTQSAATSGEAALLEAQKAWSGGGNNINTTLAELEQCTATDCVRLAAAVKRLQRQMTGQDPRHSSPEFGTIFALDQELKVQPPGRPVLRPPEWEFAREQANALIDRGFPADTASHAFTLFIAALDVSSRAPDLAARNFREVVSLVPGTELAKRAEQRIQELTPAPPELPVAPAAPVEPAVDTVIEPAPTPPADEASSSKPSVLLEQGKLAKREKRYGSAIALLERCLALSPADVECTVALATTHAAKGTDENDVRDTERARALYRKFLRIASPDDRRILRVQEILHATVEDPVPGGEVRDLYLRGYQLRESAPDEARQMFEEVIRLAPDSIDAQKAKSRLAELGRRGPMGRLKIASIPTNARVFIDGVDTGHNTPVLPSEPIEVTPGTHTIYAEVGGRRSASTQVHVVEGDNPVIKLLVQ